MSPPPPSESASRRSRITEGLRGRGLEQAFADRGLWRDLEDEARSGDPDRLVTDDMLAVARRAREVQRGRPPLGLFFSTDDVILVPGFLGSELADFGSGGGGGVIWIDPKLLAGSILGTDELLKLKLAPYRPGRPDKDAMPGVSVRPNGAIPVIYGALRYDLEVRRYAVQVFGFDWRKHVDESAAVLAALIRDRAARRFRPLHLVAHSQGTVVARRALQFVGADLSRRLVSNLVLLGPATAGTFSAAFGIAGSNGLIETVRRFGIRPPVGFEGVLQSMTGLYQLLPWRTDPVSGSGGRDRALDWVRDHRARFVAEGFWETGVDADRLADFFGWGRTVDAGFLNDRTTLILGDRPTAGGVKFEGGKLVEDPAFSCPGDGTVPDSLARVEGVARVFKAKGAEHMMLPATLAVIAAVRDVLAGRPPEVDRAVGLTDGGVPFLAVPDDAIPAPRAVPVVVDRAEPPDPTDPGPEVRPTGPAYPAVDLAPPQNRRLRVFSFDPMSATDLDGRGAEHLTIDLPWEFADGDRLEPGPVGEYLEVVDYDPASGCFYPPVDLNHPHVLAQDGLAPSEGDPRFHQQMAYAVAMATIRKFEEALGRVALWAPRLERDRATGEVVKSARPEDEFVRRLRIYPHGLRQANAYYHPDKKALLLGYFPAPGSDVGRNLPGGMVFSGLSHDILAHETTHALLDGLHRDLTEPSNPDVYAFHEAFADVVALFQHFAHPEVLRPQIAAARGDLRREGALGVLAAQFGEATGHRAGLRQYLGRKDESGRWVPIVPDKGAIGREAEPHARGAILVAALFRAFVNIYENRVADLRRIATGGTGVLAEGDLHPDLVDRMAGEAAKAAGHMLAMCIRALDYIPPVDLTFGEYLRALITADHDLVRDDDRRYRVSVVAAFRDWGIYPGDVRSLSVDSLLWCPPEVSAFQDTVEALRAGGTELSIPAGPDGSGGVRLEDWGLRSDRLRAFVRMRTAGAWFHGWLRDHVKDGRDSFLGLALGDDAPRSIRRGRDGRPTFEVHAMRPCRRIGPDGQQRSDIVVEVVQRRKASFDPDRQRALDRGDVPWDALDRDFSFRGGCTLIIDAETGDVRYCVRKSIRQDGRLEAERRFRQGTFGDRVGGIYLASDDDQGNPFGFLHGGS